MKIFNLKKKHDNFSGNYYEVIIETGFLTYFLILKYMDIDEKELD